MKFAVVLFFGCAGLAIFARAASTPSQVVRRHSIDHIGLGTADLEKGMAWVAEKTGVRPVKGGVHPGRGTQNALMSLGGGTYLEVLAPVPGAKLSNEDARLLDLATPNPIFWAVASENLDETARLLQENGFSIDAIAPGSRKRADGSILQWRRFGITGAGLEQAPFFIEWGKTSPHPSKTSPGGCTLEKLEVLEKIGNEPALPKLFSLLRVDVAVHTAPEPGLRIALKCPRGEVVFGP